MKTAKPVVLCFLAIVSASVATATEIAHVYEMVEDLLLRIQDL